MCMNRAGRRGRDFRRSPVIWHSPGMADIGTELIRLHASFCKGLADPKRLQIINALRDGPLSVSEICSRLGLHQTNASQHLAVLRQRGLARSRREGRRIYYELTSPKIAEALDLLLEVMHEQILPPPS